MKDARKSGTIAHVDPADPTRMLTFDRAVAEVVDGVWFKSRRQLVEAMLDVQATASAAGGMAGGRVAEA